MVKNWWDNAVNSYCIQEESSLGDQEDASKQGRRIDDIDTDAEITLVDKTQGRYGDEDMFRVEECKTQDKRVVMQEPSESTPTISLQLPSQVKGQGSKDKGKAKMIEPEKPLKKKDHIKFDEEEALRLHAKIDADYQMAKQMKAVEQEELSIEEKSKLFVQLLEARKKHFATKKAEEKRNRPPTRAQQRSIMCSEVRAEGSETRKKSSSKRVGDELEQEKAKKQNVDEDKETPELQSLMKVIPDEKEVAVDAIPLATKPSSIVD
ncbi:hypothetical protein Tco_1026856 [Tanacetum coccineum]